ncbi:hypothetical protein [Cupriavidus numazuensis]|uniref:Oxidoreductase molybdopterin-binding domain-containing protein n=1 Tax=Cupriavidus numazuensis TaxID=221992 RepID=A0ABN7Q478_9BURK|nr:hypothetical protein [Cupriavidus numazuensis]CAG2156443.1 hypothetical protein LMG26411_05248 [Cupriavidus numazuensis]
MQIDSVDQVIGHYSDSVVIDGVLPHGRRIGRPELLAMARTHGGPTTIECYSGRHIRDVRQLRGVLLTELLDAAGMQTLQRSRCKQLVIAVLAGDGYACLFSWHELYNSPIGKGAMLLVEQDGNTLPTTAGGLQLISLHDLRLGPRQAIAVNRIAVRAWNSTAVIG